MADVMDSNAPPKLGAICHIFIKGGGSEKEREGRGFAGFKCVSHMHA